MTITLRKRKLKKGRIKLYLDIYKGYEIKNGKTNAIREYEYLDLFLYQKANDSIKKQHNKEMLQFVKIRGTTISWALGSFPSVGAPGHNQ